MSKEIVSEQLTKQLTEFCRLCGASSKYQFHLEFLKKYQVAFFQCSHCDSLQTECPYWLEESYKDQRRFFDVGAVVRNQRQLINIYYIRRLFGLKGEVMAVDWGGGDGLFTRMMRDIGIDAYHSDKYAVNTYAAGFDDLPGKKADIITAFEVYEHLPNPGEVIDEIFARKPSIHFLTTGIYNNQGRGWGYISPVTGRHVFFYSRKAMEMIGEKYGYSVIVAGGCTLFYNLPLSSFRRSLLTRILSGKNQRIFNVLFASRKQQGLVERDRLYMIKTRR